MFGTLAERGLYLSIMAAAVQVLCPNGHRQTVKVHPNTKILQILEEVCMKKGFMPCEDYELRHGRTILDVTLSVRFANLVSNAKLELVKSAKSRAETSVVIALQLGDGTRLQHSFGPGVTLWEILMHWESQPNSEHHGKLAVVLGDQHPVCIYMRDEVIGEEALKATTLRKLGLTGGKAIIRLLHRNVDNETLQEISRQLAEERAKQEKLIARSMSSEAMSTQTSACSEKVSVSSSKLPSSRQIAESKDSASRDLTCDTSPMETDSVSPARKQPKLEPVPMEEDVVTPDGSTSAAVSSKSDFMSKQNSGSAPVQHQGGHSRNSDVEVNQPGAPVRLSAEQQRLVDSLVHVIKPQINQPRKPQNGQATRSATSRRLQQPPAPFKFPEETKGQALYHNELSAASNAREFEPCDRETIVYSLDEAVQHDPDYNAELPDDFFEVTLQDLKRMMADKVKELESIDEQPLLTKSMQQALMEEKLSKYERVVIRIQFPDRLVLQGLFRPKETVYSVEKFVKEHLEDKSTPFYLYTAPPKCVLKDKSSTLLEAKLVPASVVYFGADSKNVRNFLSVAVANECSSRLDADKVVLKSLPTESAKTSDHPIASSSKKGGQPKKSKPLPVDYRPADKPKDGQGEEKKVPKWFASGLKK